MIKLSPITAALSVALLATPEWVMAEMSTSSVSISALMGDAEVALELSVCVPAGRKTFSVTRVPLLT